MEGDAEFRTSGLDAVVTEFETCGAPSPPPRTPLPPSPAHATSPPLPRGSHSRRLADFRALRHLRAGRYEDYLDEHITPTDLFYLEDVGLARQLVELGYRGSGEILKRHEFEVRKQAIEEARLARMRKKPKAMASAGKVFSRAPLLQALAQREEAVRSGKLTTIVFIRDKNEKGQEVSGYIDFAHRLKTENLKPVFEQRKRLLPKTSDLSFYNWETQTSTSNPTPNFQVFADNEAGLLFKNKRDRKIINVDPQSDPGDNSVRTNLETHEYTQVVIYDHVTRRKL